MPPFDPDWYFVRAASIARKIYLNGGIGVGALAHWYGKVNKGKKTKPAHHATASRGLIRHILIQLERIGVVESLEDGGRKVTKEGQKDLDTIARSVVIA
jgi:small subunit ribosomal protein S19e